MLQRPEPGTIPDAPGSYQFKDARGRVIYVGKAKSLRSRLSNYFGPPETLLPRTRQMVAAAATVEWIEVRNEVEALFLEYNLIKRHRPRFNIRLQGRQVLPVPRGHPRRGVAAGDGHPRHEAQGRPLLRAVRPRLRDPRDPRPAPAHVPDPHVHQNKFDRHHRLGRPCLYAHIEKCVAPCVGDVDHEEYAQLVDELLAFLDGEHNEVLERLEKQMHEASDALEFERAARLRDQLVSVRKAIERQQMVAAKEEDLDVIGLAEDPLEASVQVFFVRRGRVVGRRGSSSTRWRTSTARGSSPSSSSSSTATPRPTTSRARCSCPCEPEDLALYEEFLSEAVRLDRRAKRKGKVRIRVPQRGSKRELLETVTRNAEEAFAQHKLSARPTTTRAPGRSWRCRRRSTSPRRRCASSASTSRTCRAPRSSRR